GELGELAVAAIDLGAALDVAAGRLLERARGPKLELGLGDRLAERGRGRDQRPLALARDFTAHPKALALEPLARPLGRAVPVAAVEGIERTDAQLLFLE